MRVENINPYSSEGEKSVQVEEMFDSIASAYDFMNSAMSFGLHRRWRDKALKAALQYFSSTPPHKILDVATGTGDLSFRLHQLLPESYITGIDISEGMLEIARQKLKNLPEHQRKLIAFGKADCLSLPFHDGEFDLVTVAYGVRNFSNLPKGIQEMRRVLRPGGVLCIIELSSPTGKISSSLYKLYTKVIPITGGWISGDKKAYSYLPESIAACPQRDDMAAILYGEGFRHVDWKSLTLGAVTYYIAQ